jgi:hypothetical protein
MEALIVVTFNNLKIDRQFMTKTARVAVLYLLPTGTVPRSIAHNAHRVSTHALERTMVPWQLTMASPIPTPLVNRLSGLFSLCGSTMGELSSWTEDSVPTYQRCAKQRMVKRNRERRTPCQQHLAPNSSIDAKHDAS